MTLKYLFLRSNSESSGKKKTTRNLVVSGETGFTSICRHGLSPLFSLGEPIFMVIIKMTKQKIRHKSSVKGLDTAVSVGLIGLSIFDVNEQVVSLHTYVKLIS